MTSGLFWHSLEKLKIPKASVVQLTCMKIHCHSQCPEVAGMHTMLIGSDCMRTEKQLVHCLNHYGPGKELNTVCKWLS